jgi:dTDP-4-amino-4,6-dideoxygalactose transaminase
MDRIMELAGKYGLLVIEDAAQAIFSEYKGKQLGTIGDFGCFSFHETKNVVSGEGGALLVNNPDFVERAEIIREKGTDRSRFFRGQVDKYTWQDVGSSYLPSELNSAYLWGQLQSGVTITDIRRRIWTRYFEGLSEIASIRGVRLPGLEGSENAHMFQLILRDAMEVRLMKEALKKLGISAVTHYVPLHTSPKGMNISSSPPRFLPNTDAISDSLLRLPLFPDLEPQQERVISALRDFLEA